MTRLGTDYQVVWNGSEWVITWVSDTAIASGSTVIIGVEPEASSSISAAITGTATTAVESDIVDGEETIIITLTGDTFVTGTTSEDGIAAGISGSASWNSEVRDNTDNTDIVLSTTTVANDTATVTLPAAASYTISADDTITITIPAASLTTSTEAVVASPTITITNETDGTILPLIYYNRLQVTA